LEKSLYIYSVLYRILYYVGLPYWRPRVIMACLTCSKLPVWLQLCTADSLAWQTHLPDRLTCLADPLAGRLTCLADSLALQTPLPGRLTCLADSFAWQTYLPGRLTCPTPWQTILLYTQVQYCVQTHLPGKLTCLEDSLAWQTHLPGRLICPADSLA
jgi:hypothetical protein